MPSLVDPLPCPAFPLNSNSEKIVHKQPQRKERGMVQRGKGTRIEEIDAR